MNRRKDGMLYTTDPHTGIKYAKDTHRDAAHIYQRYTHNVIHNRYTHRDKINIYNTYSHRACVN